MTARFLQIHTLTAYPAALLNRDDSGYAKRLPFGGATRTRISSQCLKRHWRTAEDEFALDRIGPAMSVRSRETFAREIVAPLVAAGRDPAVVAAAAGAFMAALFKESAKAKGKKDKGEGPEAFKTSQIITLGRPEVDYLKAEIETIVAAAATAEAATAAAKARTKSLKNNLNALAIGSGLDAALFGRMVTSDVLARTNAAIHVAHAFTVHAEESESDFFTAVDDLVTGIEESGGGHLGQVELTSGLYYGYVVVDFPTLVSNLTGTSRSCWETADHTLAATVAEHLVHLIATVSPGAKLGSTAPYAWAQLVLLETGSRQPRSLANAFHTPVRAGQDGMLAEAAARLAGHLGDLDAVYGCRERRWQAGGPPLPSAERLAFDPAVAAAVAALGR